MLLIDGLGIVRCKLLFEGQEWAEITLCSLVGTWQRSACFLCATCTWMQLSMLLHAPRPALLHENHLVVRFDM